MKQKATVILIEHSTARNQSNTFADQMVDIRRTADTIHPGADGIISTAKHPSTIVWYGGNASEFEHITNVQIIAPDGMMLADAEILRNFEQPHNVTDGVQFQILI